MFAKAAASATGPYLKGMLALDSFDTRFILYENALIRLRDLIRVLKQLEISAAKSTPNRTVTPMMNYVLALCRGPLFNVSPVLKRRLELLLEFKLVRLSEVNPVPNTVPVDLELTWPEIDTDLKDFKNKVYDCHLQSKILNCLLKVTQNSINIYSKKYKHILMERNATKPPEPNENLIELNMESIKEFMYPVETTLGLEFAILMTNPEVDTSDRSFQKLTIQVLEKFKDFVDSKMFPAIRNYAQELQRFTKIRVGKCSQTLSSLTYPEFTLHRIFAMLLRIKYLLDICQEFIRQAYIPLRSYFFEPKSQLLTNNLYVFQKLLKKLDGLSSSKMVFSAGVNERLSAYFRLGSVYRPQASQIVDLYKEDVQNAMSNLTEAFSILDGFCKSWKFIFLNNQHKIIDGIDDENELSKMLEEKLTVDRLDYLEHEKKKEKTQREQKSGTSNTQQGLITRKTPLKLSRSGSNHILLSNQSPNIMNRDASQKAANLLDPDSLSASRTVSSRKPPSPTNVKSTVSSLPDKKVAASESLRKRSLSLQLVPTPPVNSQTDQRSNSLQSDSILNQKMLQNSIKTAMSRYKQKPHLAQNPSIKTNKIGFLRRSMSQSPIRSPVHSLKRNDSENESLSIAALSLDEVSRTKSPNGTSNRTPSHLNLDRFSREDRCTKKDKNNFASEEAVYYPLPPVSDRTREGEPFKKVRFTGVPPPNPAEDPKPKRRGWYKKPAVLHYPTPPTHSMQKNKFKQEGFVFRTSLREQEHEQTGRRLSSFMDHAKEPNTSNGLKFASKIRDKLIR
ncbi:protein phosphatase regulator GIP4 Ecym_5060 [Eremothecium cymbalariae DBVPG|uniref:GLC7-interacting protein 4 n=1 Tax=Eremothecium cymbalariae (strain CBS 270.75 / DBVPG 7215 / KCTC 17166 / NRRL Y-17582) TaxID=931890 RepID=I6NCQ8_ERECY|nr:hypothetical protein Ecym_5060 [Eremothecium cymbalariae DBVPG\